MAWADRSPLERAALAYCAPKGIPLSVFLHQRVIYPGDPQWLFDDTEAALEWQASICLSCGHSLDETLGPENFDKWNAEVSGHCDACRALHRAASVLAGNDDLDPNVGARFRVWRDEEE